MTVSNNGALHAEIAMLHAKVAALEAGKAKSAALAEGAAMQLSRFKAMIDVVPVGVVLTNLKGQVLLGNDAVETLLRHPLIHSPDVEGYGAWVSFHNDGRRVEPQEYPIAQVLLQDADEAELNVHYQRGDGTLFWLRIIAQAVFDAQGQQIGAVAALVDVDQEVTLSDRQDILIAELNHRVKNAFSVFKSIVSQSLRNGAVPQGVRKTIDERLSAYADAHAKLLDSDWAETDLATMVSDVVVKMAGDRLVYGGPEVRFPARQSLAISMALYELCVNAVKYGALSVPQGRVTLRWHIAQAQGCDQLFINWVERDGPQAVDPEKTGFGSFILDRVVSMETAGEVMMSFAPEGVTWQLRIPLDELIGAKHGTE